MNIIPFYDSFEEKQKDFDCIKIEQIDDLSNFIYAQENYTPNTGKNSFLDANNYFQNKFIYRGLKESKFRLNTSLQLRYDEIEYFHPSISVNDYLCQMVGKLKEKEIINQRELTDIGIIALMQHYGLPTPFMDWTPNIKVGLNFAYDGINMTSQNNDISNYVSLYYIDLIANYELSASSYQNILCDSTNQSKKFKQNGDLDGVDCSNASLNNLFNINDIDIDFIYIEYLRDSKNIKDIFGKDLDINNPNISMQEGAFIINSKKEKFLNELWNEKMNRHKMISEKVINIANTDINMILTTSQGATGIVPNTRINCVDIRKEVLKQWIKTGGYTDHYNNSEESKNYEKIILSTYYNWLLERKHEEQDTKYFYDTFVVKGSDVSKSIAKEVYNAFSV